MKQSKQIIKSAALKLFSEKGYDGVSIRDIAFEADCAIPSVYYYFKNKEGLYKELAYDDFLELNKVLQSKINQKADFKEIYIQALLHILHLQEEQRMTYKLAVMTSLGVSQFPEVQQLLLEWEQTRYAFAAETLKKIYKIDSEYYANILSRVSSNMIMQNMLLEKKLTDQQVKDELMIVFELIEFISKQ